MGQSHDNRQLGPRIRFRNRNDQLHDADGEVQLRIPRFAINTSSGEQQINSTTTLPLQHLDAPRRHAFGQHRDALYQRRSEAGTNTNMTVHPTALGATTLNYIGDSQFSADPYCRVALTISGSTAAPQCLGNPGLGETHHRQPRDLKHRRSQQPRRRSRHWARIRPPANPPWRTPGPPRERLPHR